MLATRGTYVPEGEEWQHEVKWDGVRILADVADGRATRLTSRNENVVSLAWPDIVAAPTAHRDLLADGEIIGLDESGRPDFGVLQPRMHVRRARDAARLADAIPATYMVFDLVRLDGEDLARAPLHERRAALESLDLTGTSWQVPATYDDGSMLFDATLQQGLEGMVSKRVTSRYEPGARSRAWLKFPHRRRGSYVVGGWRPEIDSRDRLGAVLVGEPTEAGLIYRGRVGSGISGLKARTLQDLLAPLGRDTIPFDDDVPKVDALGTFWVEPVLVVDVESLGLSTQQRLRQPAYQGVRNDLTPEDLR
jgi:bifunctional non-homologous end joining protein LigD